MTRNPLRWSLLVGAAFLLSSPASADQQILDDLIVDGSICVGQDCVNGESFGFDTLRLKENNLRIKFQDTSATASFPSNDWQITANDSSNGGANKFSIEDIDGAKTPFTIEAGTKSNALYLDSSGKIGNGTNSPVADLHIKQGNTPTVRLEQDGSSGFTSQTWDLAGNEANFFLRDATNGSRLPLRVEPSTPSNTLYLDSTGNVGFGTTSPDAKVDIEATTPAFRLTSSGVRTFEVNINSASGRLNIDDITAGTAPFKMGAAADNNLLRVGIPASNQVDISGILTVSGQITAGSVVTSGGGTCTPGPCDGTFKGFEVPSIEEHAEYMWANHHLWGVGPHPDGEAFELGKRVTGMLHELEVAHIYIEQLNKEKAELEARLERIEKLLK